MRRANCFPGGARCGEVSCVLLEERENDAREETQEFIGHDDHICADCWVR